MAANLVCLRVHANALHPGWDVLVLSTGVSTSLMTVGSSTSAGILDSRAGNVQDPRGWSGNETQWLSDK